MRLVTTTALVFLFFQAGQGPAQQQRQDSAWGHRGPCLAGSLRRTDCESAGDADKGGVPTPQVRLLPRRGSGAADVPIPPYAAGKFSFQIWSPARIESLQAKWLRADELRRAVFRWTWNDCQPAFRSDDEGRDIPACADRGRERPSPGFLRRAGRGSWYPAAKALLQPVRSEDFPDCWPRPY